MRNFLTDDVSAAFANLLRVMRGGGAADRVLGDIEAIGAATAQTKSDFGLRTQSLHDVLAGLKVWWPEHTDHPEVSEFEFGVCDAALRVIAARLDGNSTQRSRALSDMIRHFRDREQRLAGDMKKEQDRQIDRIVAEAQSRHRAEARAGAGNLRVLAAANDNAESYVYFITDGEAIKIGKANNPKSRLAGLQTSHHKPLRFLATMPGGSELERELHRVFSAYRIRGEWFKDCKDIRDFIKRHDSKAKPSEAA